MEVSASDNFSDDVVEFFNSEFDSDLSNLNKLQSVIDRLLKFSAELELEVHPQNLTAGQKCNFTQEADSALKTIEKLKEECNFLQASVETELTSSRSIRDHFYSKIKELKEVESSLCYLQWVLRIEVENSRIEDALANNTLDVIIDIFSNFKTFWEHLKVSECKFFLTFLRKTIIYWHDALRKKYGGDFQKLLGQMYWPVLSSNLIQRVKHSEENLIKFKQLFLFLCKISLPDECTKKEEGWENILLPLQMMLQPLQKRFIFHFMGKKPTNRIDRPEWYFTQILTWISDHSHFLEDIVQPILDQQALTRINAHMQAMKGLVHLAILRLKADLPRLLDDDKLFSHNIDEAVLFVAELQRQGYPSSFPSIMHLLTEEPCFSRWKSLEHQSALEKMDKFLSLNTAWKSRYQDESDLDDLHVPESAEMFVTLLLTMTERYCCIGDRDCQLSFLDLQLELLDDFRLRHHQLSQCETSDSGVLQEPLCGILNAIHHITQVLQEWNNLPFFLQLHSYKKRKDACERLLNESEKQLPKLSKRTESKTLEDETLEASVFDEPISLFQHMQTDLLQTTCDRVLLDVKAKSRPYRKEKWFCIPAVHDKKQMEVSSAAFPMLNVINSSLHSLEGLLTRPLFTRIWKQIASELNVYIYEEVVLQNSFNDGGATQFNFDMTRNLFPIFGAYSLKPENYFPLIRDSCVLLTLNTAPAMLLRETLQLQPKSKASALNDVGVRTLSSSQALVILQQRTG